MGAQEALGLGGADHLVAHFLDDQVLVGITIAAQLEPQRHAGVELGAVAAGEQRDHAPPLVVVDQRHHDGADLDVLPGANPQVAHGAGVGRVNLAELDAIEDPALLPP